MTIGKWIKKWKVNGSEGKEYTVSLSDQGVYGCSCPRWKFHREECHHIQEVQADGGSENGAAISHRPEYVLAHIDTPTLENGKLLIPLVPFGDVEMNATICVAMLENGYSWSEVKERRGRCIGQNWTAGKVKAHVERYGRAIIPCCDKWPHRDDDKDEKEGTK